MRLQVSEPSTAERSASGTSEGLAPVPSKLAEKAWTTALGRGSTSTSAIPPRTSTGDWNATRSDAMAASGGGKNKNKRVAAK